MLLKTNINLDKLYPLIGEQGAGEKNKISEKVAAFFPTRKYKRKEKGSK